MSHKALGILTLAAMLSFPAGPGMAQGDAESLRISGPIQHGVKHQPTRSELGGGEFSRSQQEETDKLYDELLSNYEATHHSGNARTR